MGSIPDFPQRFTLRLFNPSPEDEAIMEGATLGEWFREYYLPFIAKAERNKAESTIAMEAKAVDYWERFGASNKPLSELTKQDIAQWNVRLREEGTFSRGAAGKPKPLSPVSCWKQVKLLKRVLRAAFLAEVLRKEIKYEPRDPGYDRKETYTLEECRAIWKVLPEARLPKESPNRQLFWEAFIAALFYTGMRAGTVLALKKSYFSVRKGRRWLSVPGSANTKTRKEWEGPVHPLLAAAIDKIETPEIFPQPWRMDTLSKEALRLAKLAGIAQPMRLHVWRRVHSEQMGDVGCEEAERAVQESLQHSSVETTRRSYTKTREGFVMLLPRLDS